MVRHLLAITLLGAAGGSVLFSPAQVMAEDYEYSTSLAQGKSYYKDGLYREAYREFRKALSTKTGDRSFEAHLLYAQAAFKIYDVPEAVEFSRLALELAADGKEKQTAGDFNTYLTMAFGKVEFVAGEDELKEGYLILEPQEPMLDPDIQAFYDAKVAPFLLQKRSLPWIMWLPAIAFEFNGQDVFVEPGELIQIEAGFTEAIAAEQEAQVTAIRAEQDAIRRSQAGLFDVREGAPVGFYSQVGAGVLFNSNSDLGMSSLNPVIDLTVGKEFGSIGVMAFADVSPTSTDTLNPNSNVGAQAGSLDPNLGLMGTFRVWLPAGLSLLPGVGLSYGMQAGTVYDCDRSTASLENDALTFSDCSAVTSEEIQSPYINPYRAYIQAKGLGPVARLGLVYEREMPFGYLGGTLTLHGSYLNVTAPNTNETTASDGTQIVVELDSPVKTGLLRAGVVFGVNAAF